ncbi:SMC-Scp complex subunit ScpB [Mariniblastus fucicola]|uniref:Segregation and condensation protein B n=1 Tax=Mariniblastus fucicola TaxID=980251 RepID=A0A5B9P833_9BACT|nr:SMC-Scp complex subunit ScpB [Mariniblastus fucicola]QEG21375.1 Segregation and condensation protein B [Mariniblastus fucicola]
MSTNENQEPFDDDGDDELSLDRLSEAYAEVLRQQANNDGQVDGPSRGELVTDKLARDESEEDEVADDSIEDEAEEQFEDQPDDDSGCPITPESIVESILFVGVPRGEKLTSRKIASVMRDVSPKEVRSIAEKLNTQYEKENAAYRISVDSDSIRMVVAEDLASLQNEYFGRNREVALSQNAIDILAVVAYRQPISREEVEKARNKPVGGVLNQLVRRDLLTTVADQEKPKRKLYQTTDRFLDLFNLMELADLPQSHDVTDMDDFE